MLQIKPPELVHLEQQLIYHRQHFEGVKMQLVQLTFQANVCNYNLDMNCSINPFHSQQKAQAYNHFSQASYELTQRIDQAYNNLKYASYLLENYRYPAPMPLLEAQFMVELTPPPQVAAMSPPEDVSFSPPRSPLAGPVILQSPSSTQSDPSVLELSPLREAMETLSPPSSPSRVARKLFSYKTTSEKYFESAHTGASELFYNLHHTRNLVQFKAGAFAYLVTLLGATEVALKENLPLQPLFIARGDKAVTFGHSLKDLVLELLKCDLPPATRRYLDLLIERKSLEELDKGFIWGRYLGTSIMSFGKGPLPSLLALFKDITEMKTIDTLTGPETLTAPGILQKLHFLAREASLVFFASSPEALVDEKSFYVEEKLAEFDDYWTRLNLQVPPKKTNYITDPALKANNQHLRDECALALRAIHERMLAEPEKPSFQEMLLNFTPLQSAIETIDADEMDEAAIYHVLQKLIGSTTKLFENLYVNTCQQHKFDPFQTEPRRGVLNINHKLCEMREVLRGFFPSIPLNKKDPSWVLVKDFDLGTWIHYPKEEIRALDGLPEQILKASYQKFLSGKKVPYKLSSSFSLDIAHMLLPKVSSAIALWTKELRLFLPISEKVASRG